MTRIKARNIRRDPLGLELLLDAPTAALVRELLHEVIDPELGLDIAELGLLRAVHVRDGAWSR